MITGRFISTATKIGSVSELNQNSAMRIIAITGMMRIICSGILKKCWKNVEYAVINPSKNPSKSEIKNDIMTLINVAKKFSQKPVFLINVGMHFKI